MKKYLFLLLMAVSYTAIAQTDKIVYEFTEASSLTLTGKLMPTPNPYHRVDTVKYKGFTPSENNQVRCPAGMAVAFRTDSPVISVKTQFGSEYSALNTMPLSYRGYDLYIKRDGKWVWAACGASKPGPRSADNVVLIKNMDRSEKECLLYLPIYSEIYSLKIGVEKGASITALESPFRHRVAIFGSSFTQGISTSRPGMGYPMQFTRHTGIQMLNLGCSANCRMQPYFASVLADVEADAFVFDAFSNPSAENIRLRLFPFIEQLQKAHPGKPLIFQQTIYRERRNFDMATDAYERAKQNMADSLMDIAVKKYKDVYFIKTNSGCQNHETSVDGIHPNDYGYYLWSKSIEKKLLRIFKKYGIR